MKNEGTKHGNTMMEKTELLEIIKKLLKTETDLDFLLNLPESDRKTGNGDS